MTKKTLYLPIFMPLFLNSAWIHFFLWVYFSRFFAFNLGAFTSWRQPMRYRASKIRKQQWSGEIQSSSKHHTESILMLKSFMGLPSLSTKSAGKRWQKLHLCDAGFLVSLFRILPSIMLNLAVKLTVTSSSHWYGSKVLKSRFRRSISASIASENDKIVGVKLERRKGQKHFYNFHNFKNS